MNAQRRFSKRCVARIGLLLACLFFSAAAHGEQRAKAPLSFLTLGDNQKISFLVYENGYPPASFDVEVVDRPQPQAKIRLEISSSISNSVAAKIWGHPPMEQVVRPLTREDLQELEDFLKIHRARGEIPPPDISRQPAISFERSTLKKYSNGLWHAEPDRVDFYPISNEAMHAFIRNFIGFHPNSN